MSLWLFKHNYLEFTAYNLTLNKNKNKDFPFQETVNKGGLKVFLSFREYWTIVGIMGIN